MTSAKEFSLIRFSPSPEEIESVNVGIVLWESAPRLLIDNRFSRLRCVAPEADIVLLAQYLHGIEGQLKRKDGLLASSQFTLSVPRQIVDPQARNLEAMLQRKYLVTQRKAPAKRGEREEYTDSRLHDFLVKVAGISQDRIFKRAAPVDFLPPEIAREYFPKNGLRFARVAVGRKGILATDAINRTVAQSALEKRALKVGTGFYHLGKVQNALRERKGQSLVRVVVFFGEVKGRDREVEYIEASLERDVEEVVEAEHPTTEFLEMARDVTAELF